MCNLSDNAKSHMMEFVRVHFLEKRKIFTGADVVKKMKEVHLDKDISTSEISAYCRELYNERIYPFDYYLYATAAVGGKHGPLLYFPMPTYIVKRSDVIQEKIECLDRLPGDMI